MQYQMELVYRQIHQLKCSNDGCELCPFHWGFVLLAVSNPAHPSVENKSLFFPEAAKQTGAFCLKRIVSPHNFQKQHLPNHDQKNLKSGSYLIMNSFSWNIMCKCSRNATKASTMCQVQSVSAPFSARNFVPLYYEMKFCQVSCWIQIFLPASEVFKRPLIKTKGWGGVRGQEGKFPRLKKKWTGETQTELNGTTESSKLCCCLCGESSFTLADHQKAPVKNFTHLPLCLITLAPHLEVRVVSMQGLLGC